MKIDFQYLSGLNLKRGDLAWIKYKQVDEYHLGQIGLDDKIKTHPVFDEKNSILYIHFSPQSHITELKIEDIDEFYLVTSKIIIAQDVFNRLFIRPS